jgi:hypothetical protein
MPGKHPGTTSSVKSQVLLPESDYWNDLASENNEADYFRTNRSEQSVPPELNSFTILTCLACILMIFFVYFDWIG